MLYTEGQFCLLNSHPYTYFFFLSCRVDQDVQYYSEYK